MSKATAEASQPKCNWEVNSTVLGWVGFVSGIFWIFSFPAITITTGELKPRGTFSDENALLAHHSIAVNMDVKALLEEFAIPNAQPSPVMDPTAARSSTQSIRHQDTEDIDDDDEQQRHKHATLPMRKWLCSKLADLQLPCHEHCYVDGRRDESLASRRCSAYTILRPVGIESKEAIVLLTFHDLSSQSRGKHLKSLTNRNFKGHNGSQQQQQPLPHHRARGDDKGHAPLVHHNGVSVLLGVLSHLRDTSKSRWLAKNIIMLVVDEEDHFNDRLSPGAKAFIDDYHTDTLTLLQHQRPPHQLIEHAGRMQAAVVVDLGHSGQKAWTSVNLLFNGINGELPNMDFLNTVVHHVGRLPFSLDRCADRGDRSRRSPGSTGASWACFDGVSALQRWSTALWRRYLEETTSRISGASRHRGGGSRNMHFLAYWSRLCNMLGHMASMAMGPTGSHAHFLRYSIDAVTIQGVPLNTDGKGDTVSSNGRGGGGGGGGAVDAGALMAVMVKTVRTMSNIEEDLHHSFFFYFMLSPQAFVSFGEYLYAAVLLLMPLFGQVFYMSQSATRLYFLMPVMVIMVLHAFGGILLWAVTAVTSFPSLITGGKEDSGKSGSDGRTFRLLSPAMVVYVATWGGYALVFVLRICVKKWLMLCEERVRASKLKLKLEKTKKTKAKLSEQQDTCGDIKSNEEREGERPEEDKDEQEEEEEENQVVDHSSERDTQANEQGFRGEKEVMEEEEQQEQEQEEQFVTLWRSLKVFGGLCTCYELCMGGLINWALVTSFGLTLVPVLALARPVRQTLITRKRHQTKGQQGCDDHHQLDRSQKKQSMPSKTNSRMTLILKLLMTLTGKAHVAVSLVIGLLLTNPIVVMMVVGWMASPPSCYPSSSGGGGSSGGDGGGSGGHRQYHNHQQSHWNYDTGGLLQCCDLAFAKGIEVLEYWVDGWKEAQLINLPLLLLVWLPGHLLAVLIALL